MATHQLTVLQVLPALESGGVEKGTLEVAKALVERGHKSLVISAGGQLVNKLEQEGSEHFSWPIGKKSPLTFFLAFKLRRFLRENKINIVHVRSRMPAWVVHLALKLMPESQRPKLVSTVHGFYSVSGYSKIMTYGDKVIAVSKSVKNYILENYPETDKNKIEVINRGIDPESYPFGYKPEEKWIKQWYENYPQLKNKFTITLPGRITRIKGHHNFISIIHNLIKEGIEVKGVIAGGFDPRKKEYFDELKSRVDHEGLTDDILFVGHRSDMREVIAASDVVLSLTSKPESFGRTTLEALSMGVPVCGYDHGGVAEQLEQILPEGSVEVGEVDAVCEVIKKWMKESPSIKKQKEFLLQHMLDRTIQIYERI